MLSISWSSADWTAIVAHLGTAQVDTEEESAKPLAWTECRTRLLRIASRWRISRHDADDAVSDVLWNMVKPESTLLRRLKEMRSEKAVASYLAVTIRNAIRGQSRKRLRELARIRLVASTKPKYATGSTELLDFEDLLIIMRPELSISEENLFLRHFKNNESIGKIANAMKMTYSKTAIFVSRLNAKIRKYLRQ